MVCVRTLTCMCVCVCVSCCVIATPSPLCERVTLNVSMTDESGRLRTCVCMYVYASHSAGKDHWMSPDVMLMIVSRSESVPMLQLLFDIKSLSLPLRRTVNKLTPMATIFAEWINGLLTPQPAVNLEIFTKVVGSISSQGCVRSCKYT